MDAKVYNKEGKESGKVAIPEAVFGVKWNSDLVHQVVLAMQANARTSTAHTKDRSEVRGGGKKPWRQKGTGRARHGSSRSPIWIGGGVTHGPRNEKNYSQKINKKMKVKALYSVLSEKMRAGELLFVDDLALAEKKTVQAKKILASLAGINGFEQLTSKKNNAVLVAMDGKNENTFKSFGNFSNVAIEEVRNLNPVDVLTYKYLILANPEESVAFLSGKMEAKEKKTNGTKKEMQDDAEEKPKPKAKTAKKVAKPRAKK